MKFFAKIRWVASILLIIFIVLITNLIDRDNFNRLSYSINTMYEDRVVASDLLFEMLRIIQKKEIALVTSDTAFFESKNSKFDQELDQLIENYSLTKLTKKEAFIFNQFQEELKTLRQKEKSSTDLQYNELLNSIEKIDQHLYDLSKVQLYEGKRQVSISDRVKNTINLFTQVEVIFLIIMAVLIQIIILYKPKKST